MSNQLIISSLVLALATTVACKQPDDAKGGAAPKPSEAAAPATPTWTPIPHMGLVLEMPGKAEVTDLTADAPNASLFVGDTTVDVSTVTAVYAETFDAAKAELLKDPNPFKKFTKEEASDGGWHLEYELESMIDKAPVYGVQLRMTIDGKAYQCGRNADSAAARDAVARACKTLKKAG